jgi:superfamily II DNA/RNA helicase
MCQRQQQLLLDRGEKGVVYCYSKQQCEDLAEALKCAYYHAGDVDRAERLGQWLKDRGLIIATSALGTGVDFPGIAYIVHVGMPWSMIDYAQESGRGGRAGERVDSVVLVEKGEVERTMKQKSDDIDVQAIGTFIIGNGCRRGLMSGYLDGKRVECNDVETAGCDRCGEGTRGWQDAQREASLEWQQVQEVLDDWRGRRGGRVAEAQGDAVYDARGRDRDRAGRVSTGDLGQRRESQLSTVLGQSEVLRNGRGCGEAMLMKGGSFDANLLYCEAIETADI